MWLFAEAADVGAGDDTGGYVDHQARANLSVGLDVLLDGLEAAMGAVEEHRWPKVPSCGTWLAL